MSAAKLMTLAMTLTVPFTLGGCSAVKNSSLEQEINFRPSSYAERKFAHTIRQQLDFSCGAAVIATLLTYYYHENTSESRVLGVLQDLPGLTDWKKKAAEGFSFADLIFAANKFGYAAQAAEIAVSELRKLNGPIIVHFDKTSFQHFVVLRKITDDVAYVSDPIIGDSILNIADFSKIYTGNAMAIWKPGVELPMSSRLQAIRDGLSVSDVVGTRVIRPPESRHPIL